MKTFTINCETIDRVADGHCIPWDYEYKEYIFNDGYTDAFSLRIPQGTQGIKAILMSNDSGIKEEYDRVYLDNDGSFKKLFDVYTYDDDAIRMVALTKQVKALTLKNAGLREVLSDIRDEISLVLQ